MNEQSTIEETHGGTRTLHPMVLSVLAEVEKATEKFPTWPTDPLHALAVLGEEFGELTKDVLQMSYEPWKSNHAKVEEEAIQTAAMALRFLMSLKHYRYREGIQHDQNEPPKVSCAACDRGDYQLGHSDECKQNDSDQSERGTKR